jgi:aryl-alcohol dehydrogenase (NADP+)
MYYSEADFAVLNAATQLADERGVKPAQIALAWMLHKPGITAPIVGASKMYQLDEAIAATEMTLSDDEIRRLEEPYVPHRILGHAVAPDIRTRR